MKQFETFLMFLGLALPLLCQGNAIDGLPGPSAAVVAADDAARTANVLAANAQQAAVVAGDAAIKAQQAAAAAKHASAVVAVENANVAAAQAATAVQASKVAADISNAAAGVNNPVAVAAAMKATAENPLNPAAGKAAAAQVVAMQQANNPAAQIQAAKAMQEAQAFEATKGSVQGAAMVNSVMTAPGGVYIPGQNSVSSLTVSNQMAQQQAGVVPMGMHHQGAMMQGPPGVWNGPAAAAGFQQSTLHQQNGMFQGGPQMIPMGMQQPGATFQQNTMLHQQGVPQMIPMGIQQNGVTTVTQTGFNANPVPIIQPSSAQSFNMHTMTNMGPPPLVPQQAPLMQAPVLGPQTQLFPPSEQLHLQLAMSQQLNQQQAAALQQQAGMLQQQAVSLQSVEHQAIAAHNQIATEAANVKHHAIEQQQQAIIGQQAQIIAQQAAQIQQQQQQASAINTVYVPPVYVPPVQGGAMQTNGVSQTTVTTQSQPPPQMFMGNGMFQPPTGFNQFQTTQFNAQGPPLMMQPAFQMSQVGFAQQGANAAFIGDCPPGHSPVYTSHSLFPQRCSPFAHPFSPLNPCPFGTSCVPIQPSPPNVIRPLGVCCRPIFPMMRVLRN